MARKLYDLTPFTEWLASNGHSSTTVRRCEAALVDILISYRQPLGVVDPTFAGSDPIRLREHLDRLNQDQRTRAVTAWNQWRRWIGTMGWGAPVYETRNPMSERDPLEPFVTWLAAAASASTVVGYRARMRGVVQYMGWADLPPPAVDAEALQTYLEGLPASTATLARSAWGAFAAWAKETRAVTLPDVRRAFRARIAMNTRTVADTDQSGLPVDVESAIWTLFRECARFTPDVAPALTWRCVVREGLTVNVRDPRSVQAGGWTWRYESRYAWDVLTKWAAGDAADPDPEQPLLPSDRGGTAPIDLMVLHRVIARGRRLLLPALIPRMPDPKELAARPFPPPPPPPGGLTLEEFNEKQRAREATLKAARVARSPQATSPVPVQPLADPGPLPPPGESVATMVGRLDAWLTSRPHEIRKHAVRFYRMLLVEAVSESEEMFCRFSGNSSLIELVETAADREAWRVTREYMASLGLNMRPLPSQ
jgi:hypothetical protein